jgi:hypothetical protein
MNDVADFNLYRQSIIDDQHLKLLSLGYMISAGFNALFSLLGLFYVFMGIFMGQMIRNLPESSTQANQPPPAFFGWLFAGIGLAFMGVFLTLGALKFVAASCLKKRTSRILCMVVAGITCLEFPYGTALGVLTFIALGRESVIRQFDQGVVSQPVA